MAGAPRMSWLTLALMTTSSVASLRAAPTMAVYGLACVFLYLVPAIVFLLPTALVSAELASGWEGGVYRWVSEGLSKPLGFLAVWCQFAMTIFYYPSLLAYVAPTIAYVVNPSLASNVPYTAVVIMVLYWSGVWVSSLRNPAKEFPRSMFTASTMVLLIFILPALAISWVVPSSELSLTAGVMQAFDAFFQYFHIGWLTPVIAVALVSASLGGMLTWLAGPSKGLLMISRQEGHLPPFLQRLNKEGVQQNLLVTQGVVTTVIALAYALIPNASSAYWIFSVITTQVYLIVYLLMFVAAIRLRRTQPDHPRGYRAPALVTVCVTGFLASAAAMAIGFVPSSQFGGGSVWAYVAIVGGGLVVLGLLIPYLFLRLRKPEWRSPEAQAELAAQEAEERGTEGGAA
ncbi:APC family permease [Streptomyces sp. CB01881]|uniref:APC family permease n=1 Tax=Streptomyces sp. CB01881 TaxID=2078691 RepID=UPI000CDBE66F|nr:APC family permease [Streptomyces sp. CB01881]AUY54394.1 amino acid:proton antiporter [Streptomyces sp. CB01881]TYC75299.1 amino acid permease [Streptomyces sp. CB01881]